MLRFFNLKYFSAYKPFTFRCYGENFVYAIIKHYPFLNMTPNTTIGKCGQKQLKQLGVTANTCLECKDVGPCYLCAI